MSSSSTDNDDLIAATRQSLDTLQVQRRALEQEGEAIIQELTTPATPGAIPAGIDTPLVDAEGYPRADVDLYRVRNQRKRLAEVRNDHKKLSQEMERYLQQLAVFQNPNKKEDEKKEYASRLNAKPKPKFDAKTGKWVIGERSGTMAGVGGVEEASRSGMAAAVSTEAAAGSVTAPMDTTSSAATRDVSPPAPPPRPFAKIDEVSEASPAKDAGLMVGDLIVQFDAVTIQDADPFAQVAQVVPDKAGQQKSIAVTVLRRQQRHQRDESETTLTMELTPRPWNGRGLIGCHIVPYSS